MSIFDTRIFPEPELEFGDHHHHPDPRLGLFEAGPLQTFVGDVIKIGVIGNAKTVEDTRKFLETAAAGVEGKSEKHPNMHPAFPGLGNQSPYRCRFEIEDGATAILSQAKLDRIAKEPDHQKAVEMAVDEIVAELEALADGGKSLASSILDAMGDNYSTRGEAELLLRRVRQGLREFGVELLVVDELNHFRQKTLAKDAANTIKNILTLGWVPIVLMGTTEAQSLFTDNRELKNRCAPQVVLAPYDPDDQAGDLVR